MKNSMNYKGYAARIEFDGHDRIFFGRLAGIRDIISFHGETVAEQFQQLGFRTLRVIALQHERVAIGPCVPGRFIQCL